MGSGGNKVFFVNGILTVLNEENIKIDKIVGFSSSSVIIFPFLFKKTKQALAFFAKQLDENPQNFYWFRKPHFPHDEIYEKGVEEALKGYSRNIPSDFFLIGSKTSKDWQFFKLFFSSVSLALRYVFKINVLNFLRGSFNIKKIVITNRDNLSKDELKNFIMGCSTIYPFISPHYFRGSLILEGDLFEPTYKKYLSDCEKKIIIHTHKGRTRVVKNVFYIHSEEIIPNNVVDYTNSSNIIYLHKLGESVMRKNLLQLKSFIGSSEKVSTQGSVADRFEGILVHKEA